MLDARRKFLTRTVRHAVIDTILEVEALRALVIKLTASAPTCVHCGKHLASYLDVDKEESPGTIAINKEAKAVLATDASHASYICAGCHAGLSENDAEDYEKLPWADALDAIEVFQALWTERGIAPDLASVRQIAFPFR